VSTILLQVVEGRAWESSRSFTTGTPAGPLGLGTGGDWVVDGQGVAAVHAYLYFDGNELFAATAQGSISTLNGSPLTTAWTTITAPADLQFASVRVRALLQGAVEEEAPAAIEDAATAFFQAKGPDHDEEPEMPTRIGPAASMGLPPTVKKPQAGPPPVAAGVPQVPAAGRRPPVAEDATSFLPIEQMRKGLEGPDASGAFPAAGGPDAGGPRPAAGAPAVVIQPDATAPPGQLGPPPTFGSTMPGGPPQPGQPMQPGAPGGPPAAKAGLWSSASGPKKAIYVLLPIALAGAAYTTLFDEPPPRTTKAGTSGSAKPKASAAGSASGGPAASGSGGPAAPAAVGSSLLPMGVLLPAAPRSSASAGAAGKPPKPGAKPEKTVERQAVDAVIAGNYPEALRLYEQLLKENPDVAAYQEAVKILRSKTAK
jgi:hypothetical protein